MLVKSWNIHYFDEVESTNLIVKDCIRKGSEVNSAPESKGLRQPLSSSEQFSTNGFSEAFKGAPATAFRGNEEKIESGLLDTCCRKPLNCEDGDEGFVVAAKKQTCGRGMRGHSWCSPEGGLYFSLLLEPSLAHDKLPEIPLRIATVVMEALQPLSSEPLTIKPPNDIVLVGSTAECPPRTMASSSGLDQNDSSVPLQARSFVALRAPQDDVGGAEGNRCEGLTDVNRSATCGPCKVEKLVGISTEIYMEKLCVGIGVNVFHPEKELQVEGPNHPVYLEDFSNQELTLDFVLKTVLDALNAKLKI